MTTHYWNRRGTFTASKFAQAVKDCELVCQSEILSDSLAGWDGSGSPLFTENQISFNGVDDESNETFSIERDRIRGIESCITRGSKYDLAVRCCLLILRHYLPEEIEISSEDRESLKWEEAQNLVNEVLEWDDEFKLDAI